MGGAFSSGSSSKKKPLPKNNNNTINEVDRAILDLKNARDRLTKYKKKLEGEQERLLQRAQEYKKQNRTSTALGLLRLRRYKQNEVENVENKLLTVLQIVETIDSKRNEKEVLDAMKVGKNALAKLHQETTVEDVLDLMDQIKEEHEVEDEISSLLQSVPTMSAEDEADVEAELSALEEEMRPNEPQTLPEAPTTKPLPAVPTSKLPDLTPQAEKPAKVAVAS